LKEKKIQLRRLEEGKRKRKRTFSRQDRKMRSYRCFDSKITTLPTLENASMCIN
jgi:hypothetical protein